MKSNNIFVLALLFFGIFISCNTEVTQKFQPKPNSFGKLNDVVVICDKELWESYLKDTLSEYFESTYPVMVTPEPIFDLRHFTTGDLKVDKVRRELRTYLILADVNDLDSPTTDMLRRDLGEEKLNRAKSDKSYNSAVGVDKWAQDQLLVYLFGNGVDQISNSIKENFGSVASRISKHDEVQLKANIYAKKGNNVAINQMIRDSFDIDLRIPADYRIAKARNAKNFMWVKKDLGVLEQHLVIRKFPYTSADQLSRDAMIKMRNDYGHLYIEGAQPNSFMITNLDDLPVYEYTTSIDGAYAKELRGTWELTRDFMAGPFITFAVVHEDKKEIIFVDVWVYGPGQSKRDYIQQLEYLVKKAELL